MISQNRQSIDELGYKVSYIVSKQDDKFIPMKEEQLEGRTYFTAIQISMNQPQAFVLTRDQKPDYSKGFSDRIAAETAARDRWGQNIQFNSLKMNNQQTNVSVYENKDMGAFVPKIEITRDGITKSGYLYSSNGKAVLVVDKAPPGMGRVDFSKGWKSLEKAQSTVYEVLGKDTEISLSTNQRQFYIYQAGKKFVPVSVKMQNNGKQFNSVLKPLAGRIVESGKASTVGELSFGRNDGFKTLKEAETAALQKWGRENYSKMKPVVLDQRKRPNILNKAKGLLNQGRASVSALRQQQGVSAQIKTR